MYMLILILPVQYNIYITEQAYYTSISLVRFGSKGGMFGFQNPSLTEEM